MKFDYEGKLLCLCKKPAQLHFSRNKRIPFVACINYHKKRGEKCIFSINLDDNDVLNQFNAKKSKKNYYCI